MVIKKREKRGILRIVEASISILIILSVLLLLMSRGVERKETDFNAMIVPVLEEMAQNSSLRGEILSYNTSEGSGIGNNKEIINDLEIFVGSKITNPALNYSVRICELKQVCAREYPLNIEGNLYSGERVISTNITESDFDPKKVKIFLWKKD